MTRASLVLLFVLLVTGNATLSMVLAAVAAGPDVTTPLAPAAVGDPGPAVPLQFGSACADIVSRSDRLLRPTRRLDDIIIRGEGPCVVF